MKTTAIILAAGTGTRAGGPVPKQYMDVNGMPVLAYSLKSFAKSKVSDIIIVSSAKDVEYVRNEIAGRYVPGRVSMVTAGGNERCFSVLYALRAIKERGDIPDIVFIHDGARPYISSKCIDRLIGEAEKGGAVIAASPAKDTIKITDENGFVKMTTDRSVTWQVETPQCFSFVEIYEAYEKIVAPLEGSENKIKITDDAMVYEEAFPMKKVRLINTGEENGKITTATDLEYMKYRMR